MFAENSNQLRVECNRYSNVKSGYKFNNDFFWMFYSKAFPDNLDVDYMCQWIDRFLNGTPSVFMDSIRTKAYIDTIKEWNSIRD